MCAVGCLILKGKYTPNIETLSLLEWDEDMFSNLLGFETTAFSWESDRRFLEELQEIHDYYPVSKWPSELNKFASKHSLKLA